MNEEKSIVVVPESIMKKIQKQTAEEILSKLLAELDYTGKEGNAIFGSINGKEIRNIFKKFVVEL